MINKARPLTQMPSINHDHQNKLKIKGLDSMLASHCTHIHLNKYVHVVISFHFKILELSL